jgi:hypothetical protein
VRAIAELQPRSHGPEVWAKRDSDCKVCHETIRVGQDVIVVVDRLGACHALCGRRYVETVNRELEDVA